MKKVVLVVLVVFLGFWMVTDPGGLASTSEAAAGGAWALTTQFFGAVIDFAAEVG